MWSYLCKLGGMGYEGGPVAGLGGWGASPCQTLLMPPVCGNLYSMQGAVALHNLGDQYGNASST